jgi:hypothetical protein
MRLARIRIERRRTPAPEFFIGRLGKCGRIFHRRFPADGAWIAPQYSLIPLSAPGAEFGQGNGETAPRFAPAAAAIILVRPRGGDVDSVGAFVLYDSNEIMRVETMSQRPGNEVQACPAGAYLE